MNPIDSNPRHFFIDAVDISANVEPDSQRGDFVTIEFAGRVTPTVRDRITTALADGEFAITMKKLA